MIDWKRQCAAIIPCFNEAGRIGPVVEGVRRHLPTVIVVDDGSTDATAREADSAGAQVIRLQKNSGKGNALRAGWREARRAGFEWALLLDGDGQHSPLDIPEFFACAENMPARLIVGNRMEQGGEMPWVRRQTNVWMSRCLSNFTGHTLPDSQCGFRLAHLDTIWRLPIAASGFVIESEMLVAALAGKERVEFVPIRTIYGVGHSKISPILDTWRWLRWWRLQPAAV